MLLKLQVSGLVTSCFCKLLLLLVLLDKLRVKATKFGRKLKLEVQRKVALTTLQAGQAAIHSS